MTLVHRHIAKSKEQTTTSDGTNQSAFRTVTRSYAQALSIPTLSIRIPEPIATHNSYSTLNDTVTSDSSMDSDKYTWNSPESDSVESDTDYSDMPPLIDANDTNDASDEYSDTDYSDMPPLIESNDSESDKSNESSDSDQEIIVNHTRYQRVRKSCKDGLPCPITFFFRLWAIAMFMQFMLYICNVTNDKCSRTL